MEAEESQGTQLSRRLKFLPPKDLVFFLGLGAKN